MILLGSWIVCTLWSTLVTTRRSFGAARKYEGGPRRRWSDEEKGRIVAEAIAPDAVIADVARRHDLAPQQLSNWIRAAKDGRFACRPMICQPSCPWKRSIGTAKKTAHERRSAAIEIEIGTIKVRLPGGIEARDVEAVLRAVRRSSA